jgi:hypothetical protein
MKGAFEFETAIATPATVAALESKIVLIACDQRGPDRRRRQHVSAGGQLLIRAFDDGLRLGARDGVGNLPRGIDGKSRPRVRTQSRRYPPNRARNPRQSAQCHLEIKKYHPGTLIFDPGQWREGRNKHSIAPKMVGPTMRTSRSSPNFRKILDCFRVGLNPSRKTSSRSLDTSQAERPCAPPLASQIHPAPEQDHWRLQRTSPRVSQEAGLVRMPTETATLRSRAPRGGGPDVASVPKAHGARDCAKGSGPLSSRARARFKSSRMRFLGRATMTGNMGRRGC